MASWVQSMFVVPFPGWKGMMDERLCAEAIEKTNTEKIPRFNGELEYA